MKHEDIKKKDIKVVFKINPKPLSTENGTSQIALILNVSMALSRTLFVFQRLSDIKHLSSTYWLLTLCLMFFYTGVLPFMSDAR